MPTAAPFVFLSHSGADTESARELKRRLLASPDATQAGLKVWLDRDDLRPGTPWSAQIAEAIQTHATAFVVYVGSGGVMNWVEAEVDLAISRATTSKPRPLLFIPALAAESKGSSALPPFAKRYQGVRDPLGAGEELGKLLKAVLGVADWDRKPRLIDEPFVGLRAMREEEADRFFGRDAELKELVAKFRKHRIVAIVADSGTGKSSLARAGFTPAFRGGTLIDPAREDARDKICQVVTMRPRADPAAGLRQGVTEAAEKLGRPLDERASLRKQVSVDDASETAYALQCGLPSANTSTLLIVDQFEELFTAASDQDAASFAALLLALAAGPSDIRILLTVRSDYFNLVSGVKDVCGRPALFERLTADNNDAVVRLKAMAPAALRGAVLEPLKLAGVSGETALADAVETDISHQASDLPLLQVALRAAWQERMATGRPMLECYQSVGRVSGALAREADNARDRLPAGEQELLESVFARLVRLGDIGGATRLGASLDAFDPRRRALLQKLGEDEFGRLVSVGPTHAELAHEALITQWPWLQGMLKTNAVDVRRLGRLMERSKEWSEAPDERSEGYLAKGAERELFDELAKQRADWLSPLDRDFVAASKRAYEGEREKERRSLLIARRNESVALTALANIEASKARWVNASKLALAAWPRDPQDTTTPKLAETLDALGRIVPNLRERRVLRGHSGRVWSASFSPDGKRVVTASNDNTARIWDAETGREIVVLNGHGNPVNSAAFSPDGKRVVTASYDHTARLWNAKTGREIVILKGHGDSINSVAFSPNGKRVATASSDDTARLWDAETGREIAALKGHTDHVNSATFSPDGKRVVTASYDNTARLWDAETGREIATLKGHTDHVNSAAFSPDGERVATVSWDGTARLWDAETGREIAAPKGHDGHVYSAAFSRDAKRVVTASGDKSARIWDAEAGREIVILEGHHNRVVSATFSPDGKRVVTASWDNTARVWDAKTGREVAILTEHDGPVYSVAFSPDGERVVTASDDNTARVWDTGTCREIATLEGHEGSVVSAAFSPNGSRVLTASNDETARVWDAETGREVASLKGDTNPVVAFVVAAAFSPAGECVVTASSDTARVWDANTGREIAVLKGHQQSVSSAAFSADGKRVVTASKDNTARVWDARTGREIAALKGHDNSVSSAVFSPDGKRIVTASEDKTARVWDAETGGEIAALEGHHSSVYSAAFSPDGKRLVTASQDNSARVWDAETGHEIAALNGHDASVSSAVFSPDGRRVVTASYDSTARLWDAETGREIVILEGHANRVACVAFSPDGQRVVTASYDNSARVWDAEAGREIATLKGHKQYVRSAAFRPDGKRVVTASDDATARVWDVSTIPKGNILQVACALLRMREDPISLEGVTDYPLTFDRPICVTDPPPPDPLAEPSLRKPAR